LENTKQNSYIKSKKKGQINSFRLPREEYSARGGLESATYPWTIYEKMRLFSCKFQTKQGDYAADQALYTVEEVI
jgi:hypothetical protein